MMKKYSKNTIILLDNNNLSTFDFPPYVCTKLRNKAVKEKKQRKENGNKI